MEFKKILIAAMYYEKENLVPISLEITKEITNKYTKVTIEI